jgi:predicted lipoprotein with Yx(FWY)xxD motif
MVARGEHLNIRLGLAVLAAGTLGLIGFLIAGTNAQGATHQSVSSASVSLRTTKVGAILVNAKGHTLYLFTKDKSAKSSCSGMCAKYWPPAIARTKPTAGTGIKPALLGTTKRSDGSKQLTYNHHPLYGFLLDKQAGQVNGQAANAFGGRWWAVSARGTAVTKTSTAPTPTTTSATTTSSSTTTDETTTSRYP